MPPGVELTGCAASVRLLNPPSAGRFASMGFLLRAFRAHDESEHINVFPGKNESLRLRSAA